jgi:uncharacterized protein (TIGR02246 family)
MTTPDATALVLEQVEAYNARDLKRMLSYYSTDAVILGGDGVLLDEGHEAIREAFGQVFAANPELHADIGAVVQVGQWVMIHSIVANWAMADGSPGEMQWIELYQVVDDKIQRVQLFR